MSSILAYAGLCLIGLVIIAAAVKPLRHFVEPKLEERTGEVAYSGVDVFTPASGPSNRRYERIFIRLRGDAVTYAARCDTPMSAFCIPHDANAEASPILEPKMANLLLNHGDLVGLTLDGVSIITPSSARRQAAIQLGAAYIPGGLIILWGGMGLLVWAGRLIQLLIVRE